MALSYVTSARAVDRRSGPRRRLSRPVAHGMLVGLDLLIAADLNRTVTLQPTLGNVAAQANRSMIALC